MPRHLTKKEVLAQRNAAHVAFVEASLGQTITEFYQRKDYPGWPNDLDLSDFLRMRRFYPYADAPDREQRIAADEAQKQRRAADAAKPAKPIPGTDVSPRLSDYPGVALEAVRAVEERARLAGREASAAREGATKVSGGLRAEWVRRAAEAAAAGDFSVADQEPPAADAELEALERRAGALRTAAAIAKSDRMAAIEAAQRTACNAVRPAYTAALQVVLDRLAALSEAIDAADAVVAPLRNGGTYTPKYLPTPEFQGLRLDGGVGGRANVLLRELAHTYKLTPKKGAK
jgi:hypothetical protein